MTGSPTLSEVTVREVRAEMGRQRVSGAALARQLGVSDMYLSRRLSGEVPFDTDDLGHIADLLKVPATQFLSIPASAA